MNGTYNRTIPMDVDPDAEMGLTFGRTTGCGDEWAALVNGKMESSHLYAAADRSSDKSRPCGLNFRSLTFSALVHSRSSLADFKWYGLRREIFSVICLYTVRSVLSSTKVISNSDIGMKQGKE